MQVYTVLPVATKPGRHSAVHVASTGTLLAEVLATSHLLFDVQAAFAVGGFGIH
jgi:hypothetical protein